MIVGEQKPIVFDNRVGACFDPVALEQAILWKTDKPVARLKRVFMYGKYPAVSIHGQKYHIHRLLMEYWNGNISNKYVHHLDENKLNSSKKNLQLLLPSVHQSITNKGRKQSPEHVAKRIDAMTKTRYGHSIHQNPYLLERAS